MSKKKNKKQNEHIIKKYDVLNCTCNSCGVHFETIKNYYKSKISCPNCGWEDVSIRN